MVMLDLSDTVSPLNLAVNNLISKCVEEDFIKSPYFCSLKLDLLSKHIRSFDNF